MKYKVVIFDLDGTILNTLDDLSDSCNFVLNRNGFPVHTKDEIRLFVGNGIPKLIERALPAGTDADTQKKILQEFSEYYSLHSKDKTKPYNGIPELFSALKNAEIKIAINTNKNEEIAKIICNDYFPNSIDMITGGRKDTPHKPDPSGVNKILSELKLSKDEALFVGDSDVDYLTGVNADIDVINVNWGFRDEKFLLEHGAKKIVKTPEELQKLILLVK